MDGSWRDALALGSDVGRGWKATRAARRGDNGVPTEVEGSRIFHNGKLLGGTIGVSCDMCDPDGSNTHPETYPKFQAQLGRVVLLRDMINWCIENPVRGKPFAADSPQMRALEAYIMAQRTGVKMEYGKH